MRVSLWRYCYFYVTSATFCCVVINVTQCKLSLLFFSLPDYIFLVVKVISFLLLHYTPRADFTATFWICHRCRKGERQVINDAFDRDVVLCCVVLCFVVDRPLEDCFDFFFVSFLLGHKLYRCDFFFLRVDIFLFATDASMVYCSLESVSVVQMTRKNHHNGSCSEASKNFPQIVSSTAPLLTQKMYDRVVQQLTMYSCKLE